MRFGYDHHDSANQKPSHEDPIAFDEGLLLVAILEQFLKICRRFEESIYPSVSRHAGIASVGISEIREGFWRTRQLVV